MNMKRTIEKYFYEEEEKPKGGGQDTYEEPNEVDKLVDENVNACQN